MLRVNILDFIFQNKSKISSWNLHSHLFKSLRINLNLLEEQRKQILEDVTKQELANKLSASNVEEEIKKGSYKSSQNKIFKFFLVQIQQKLNEFL